MNRQIIPCLWFNGNGKAAAEFYCSIFVNSQILSSSGIITSFNLNGRNYSALDGGPHFKINESMSFFVYCGSDFEIERVFKALMEGGEALMELGAYPWTSKYAWVKDKFGVSWQLDIDPINNPQNIVPSFMFANEKYAKVEEAMEFYHEIFPNSRVLMKSPYPKEMGLKSDAVQFAQHKLNGNIFNFMSSHAKHDWDFNEAFSFVITCKDQNEIDYFWSKLLKDGGTEQQCGWLKDKFGVSWQIVPDHLGDLLKKEGAMEKMLKMIKIEIEELHSI